MVSGPRQFARVVLFSFFVLLFQQALSAQTRNRALPHLAPAPSFTCREPLPGNVFGVDRRLAPLDPPVSCGDASSLGSPRDLPPDATNRIPVSKVDDENLSDPIQAELLALGKRGREISSARDFALEILQENNACSAWYLAKEPDAVAMFRSLHIVIDTQNPGLVRKIIFPNDDWIYLQPYVARAQQNVGPGSIITVNQHGAFFEDAAGVVVVRPESGPAIHESARQLYVGGYRGATEPARVLTLLHEFGHIIDLLPLDSGTPAGPEISMHNSKLVMEHCKPELEASARIKHHRAPELTASFNSTRRQ